MTEEGGGCYFKSHKRQEAETRKRRKIADYKFKDS
jgi:hypothetical protein